MLKDPTSPERWQKPGVADEAAGDWEGGAACEIAVIANGLDERWAEDRMPLSEVLKRLEAAAAGADASQAASSTAAAEEEAEARCCIICEAAPREVRFACGHAVVCGACLPSVVQQHGKCPTCGAAFGAQPVLEQGQQVAAGPTFVLPK